MSPQVALQLTLTPATSAARAFQLYRVPHVLLKEQRGVACTPFKHLFLFPVLLCALGI
eukprot:COSAG05_NODE_6700_length_918_cov_1.589744_2_plen_57_part_01